MQVIPQLIARIDIKEPKIREGLINLLERIADIYPQSLLYALNVMARSQHLARKSAAQHILDRIKNQNANLVQQALLVSNELIRSAIVLTEIWNEAIEDGARVYFPDGDPMTFVKQMLPHHRLMEKPPETHNEIAFYQGFASDLKEAEEWL